MNFTIKSKEKAKETVGITSRQNVVRYTSIPTDKISYWKPNTELSKINILKANSSEIDQLEKDNKEFKSATRLRIDFSFPMQMRMIDLLESSKILSVEYSEQLDKQFSYIIIIPHPLFDYEKLNDVLFDMVQKFEL